MVVPASTIHKGGARAWAHALIVLVPVVAALELLKEVVRHRRDAGDPALSGRAGVAGVGQVERLVAGVDAVQNGAGEACRRDGRDGAGAEGERQGVRSEQASEPLDVLWGADLTQGRLAATGLGGVLDVRMGVDDRIGTPLRVGEAFSVEVVEHPEQQVEIGARSTGGGMASALLEPTGSAEHDAGGDARKPRLVRRREHVAWRMRDALPLGHAAISSRWVTARITLARGSV